MNSYISEEEKVEGGGSGTRDQRNDLEVGDTAVFELERVQAREVLDFLGNAACHPHASTTWAAYRYIDAQGSNNLCTSSRSGNPARPRTAVTARHGAFIHIIETFLSLSVEYTRVTFRI